MGIYGGRKILLAISWHDIELAQSRLKPLEKLVSKKIGEFLSKHHCEYGAG